MSGKSPNPVCITLDLDWAPDRVIEDALGILQALDIPVTLFCTHRSPLLDGLDPQRFELAWHPNFLAGRDEAQVIDEMAGWFPGAAGVRAHALYFHSRLAPPYLRHGVRYLAHNLCFLQTGLRCMTHWTGLVDVPGFWEDDVHALYFDGDFDPARVDWTRPGLKVFDFHPIHLHLNTDRMARYDEARADLEAGRDLESHRNPGLGSRTFLEALVASLRADPTRYRLRTVAQVAAEHAADQPYVGRYRPFD